MIDLPAVNEKLVGCAYYGILHGSISLGEYEERLDWYLTDEAPPKRIHRMDFVRLEEALIGSETAMLLGEEYRLLDGGEWYGRVEERL